MSLMTPERGFPSSRSYGSPALSSYSPSSSASSSPSSSLSTVSSPCGSVGSSDGAAADASTRCRYKTGRCGNTRVVKPNGSLLLLCEFHRDQQNRTKKRSDMKYRHHRAKKRQLEKHSPRLQAPASPGLGLGLRHAASQLAIAIAQAPLSLARTSFSRPTLACESPQVLSPIVRTPTPLTSGGSPLTPSAIVTRRESALKKSALLRLRAAHAAGSRISPGKARLGHQPPSAPSPLETTSVGAPRFALSSRRDIVAMASPAAKAHAQVQPPVVFPVCPSPLRLDSPWARRAWQPEDVRLLEYFIL